MLAGCFQSSSPSSQEEAYPSLTSQRSALVNKPVVTPVRLIDSLKITDDLRFLSSDSCEGRGPGTNGHELAIQRIIKRMREAGLDSFQNSFIQTFAAKTVNGNNEGKNSIGWIKGTTYPQDYVVISAHYDHLGKNAKGEIYHGASDNASGTACLLALADFFKKHSFPYSLIFVAFDREESGIEGAKFFIDHLPVEQKSIKFNLNIDMIARETNNELFACGIFQHPELKYLVTETQKKTNTNLLMGHDHGRKKENWVYQSDHYAFWKKDIPFLYLGVEDHPDYHQVSDTFDKINLSHYIENCNVAVQMMLILDPLKGFTQGR